MATKLGVSTFKATCCGQSFEGKAGVTALEAHAKAEHKRRKLQPGSNKRDMLQSVYGVRLTAPGWKGGEPEKPTPWTAPKARKGGLEKVIRDIEAGKYEVTGYCRSVGYLTITAEGGHEAPCGELYSTEDDMRSHELTCGACAGAVEQASQ